MKLYIQITRNLLIALVISMTATSCSEDFLKEDLTTQRNLDYYNTEEGIQSLAVGLYRDVLKRPFEGETTYCNTQYGTDEFKVGGDASNGVWNNYDIGLQSIVPVVNSNTVDAQDYWDRLYLGIGNANILIQSATEIESTNDAVKKTALGEGYFFRAYNYFKLVSNYGGVPLKLKPSDVVELEFTRASAQEVFAQIIEDYQMAYDLLDNGVGYGKISKDVVAHFMAKAYLSRASEINDSWNESTKQADLQQVVSLADEVIGNHPLATNFGDLWDYTQPDDENEQLSEIILAAQFTDDVSANGGNNQHLYFVAKYDDLPQMTRDLTGDRPYSRLYPTYFLFQAYDMVNDSRFWKSFRTKHRINKASGDYYANGDLGAIFIINQPGDNRFPNTLNSDVVVDDETGKTIPSAYVAYPSGITEDGSLYNEVRFPSLSKYIDASRNSVNDTRGFRDFILARSAETYLIAAEAKVRLNQYGDALEYINAVRARAGFKAGEVRDEYTDGGAAYPSSPLGQDPDNNSFMPSNSYYESNNIDESTASTDITIASTGSLPKEDEDIISRLGYSSEYDRMLCLVLDERSRELCGEYLRWQDLSRTLTLVERAREFNPEAAPNIKDYHTLRPIPQSFLDAIQQNGSALTADQKKSLQNPGYL